MFAVAFGAVLPLSCVPQSPVQLVAVAPMVALPPVPALTVSVHCGLNLAVTFTVVAVPPSVPTMGLHSPVPLQPPPLQPLKT